LQLINPSTSSNELNTTLTPHSITHGDACFAYFNKIWGIPLIVGMDDLTDTRHISRLEIVDTGRRRRWSAAEKLRIVEESISAPRLASATARRHGISNQLLFAWRKAYRDGRLGDIPGFVPAMIVPEQPEKGTGTGCRRIEIVMANGRRVIVDCDVDVETLLRIMRGLETLP
jgi:transposase